MIRDYLRTCDAVEKFDESDELINFTFDPAKQPTPESVPDGVFYDLSSAPF